MILLLLYNTTGGESTCLVHLSASDAVCIIYIGFEKQLDGLLYIELVPTPAVYDAGCVQCLLQEVSILPAAGPKPDSLP